MKIASKKVASPCPANYPRTAGSRTMRSKEKKENFGLQINRRGEP